MFQEEGFALCIDLFAGGKEAEAEVFVTGGTVCSCKYRENA
jgi:hypothetical protein